MKLNQLLILEDLADKRLNLKLTAENYISAIKHTFGKNLEGTRVLRIMVMTSKGEIYLIINIRYSRRIWHHGQFLKERTTSFARSCKRSAPTPRARLR